jgi:hypothetical protein
MQRWLALYSPAFELRTAFGSWAFRERPVFRQTNLSVELPAKTAISAGSPARKLTNLNLLKKPDFAGNLRIVRESPIANLHIVSSKERCLPGVNFTNRALICQKAKWGRRHAH